MSESQSASKLVVAARDIFKAANQPYQELIREILKEERDVRHLKRRADIHQRIVDHIKRVIK